MRSKVFIGGCMLIMLVISVLAFAYLMRHESPRALSTRTVSIDGTTFEVEVADTPATQALGLGERDSLPDGRGMLFVFDGPGAWGIWMKGMRFPLDILWARADGTITTIERSVATSTYPRVFYPRTSDASYVLEVNAGAAASIAEGEKLAR